MHRWSDVLGLRVESIDCHWGLIMRAGLESPNQLPWASGPGRSCLNLILLNLGCFVRSGWVVPCLAVFFYKIMWSRLGPQLWARAGLLYRSGSVFRLARTRMSPLWELSARSHAVFHCSSRSFLVDLFSRQFPVEIFLWNLNHLLGFLNVFLVYIIFFTRGNSLETTSLQLRTHLNYRFLGQLETTSMQLQG